jgi:3-hydroxyisobutyrate dehydrogenase-like beta-hydroxyacid dehydrogenase
VGTCGSCGSAVRPLLEVMGRSVLHLGPLGSGHAMKCLTNGITSMTWPQHPTAERHGSLKPM